MIKVVGVSLMVVVLYALFLSTGPEAWSPIAQQALGERIGIAGIVVLGVAPVIISGGIDLSIGSMLGFSAVLFALLLGFKDFPFWVFDLPIYILTAIVPDWFPRDFLFCLPPLLFAMAILIAFPLLGALQGLLITKTNLQPFLVTLCGLFIVRGFARVTTRYVTGASRNVGTGQTKWEIEPLAYLAEGTVFGVPMPLFVFLGLAVVVGLVLHRTVFGRYLYAIGSNEQAARYAGIPTDRYKIFAYMWCSFMAGFAGIQYMLRIGSASPPTVGSWIELYAITGAVLGGCSLRGGDGHIIGIVMGAVILPLLWAVCSFAGIPDDMREFVLGVALLIGTVVDVILRRRTGSL